MSQFANSSTTNPKQGSLRVLAVGDCNTCGITVPPVGNTILDKFCQELERGGQTTTRQNLGYGMATSREGVQLMHRRAEPADVVIINYGLVDTWITSIPKVYIPYFPENQLKKRLRKLLKFVKRRLRSPVLRRFVPVGPVVPIDEYEQNIRNMIAIARSQNPFAMVMLWGSPPVQHDPDRNNNLARYDRRLEQIARETNSHFVATSPIINSLSAEAAYVDEVHLNEAATAAIAAQLAAVYSAQQLAAAG